MNRPWALSRQPLTDVRSYGAVGDGVTDDTTAFISAIDAVVELGVPLHLGGGDYLLDADGINFAHTGLTIKGGGAILRFSGAGKAFVLDQGGPDGEYVEGLSIEDIIIVGNEDVTDGFYSRGVVRSVFRNIEVREVSSKAFHIKHGVANQYDSLKCSPAGGDETKPLFGLYIDDSGEGYYTANCTFINPVMENFEGTGVRIVNGAGNLFLGGTFESLDEGLIIDADSFDNTFVKVWFEDNASYDASIDGIGNGFIGPWFLSAPALLNVQIQPTAKGTWFSGSGYIRAVEMQTGSTDTTFFQTSVDESLSGTIGFQGSGSYTRIGVKKRGGAGLPVTGHYPDYIGEVEAIGIRDSWVPTLTPDSGSITVNAEASSGQYERIGDLVFASATIVVSSVSTPGGNLIIGGLPLPSTYVHSGSVYADGLESTATSALQLHLGIGATSMTLRKLEAGLAENMADDIKAGSTLTLSIVYRATL